MRRSRCLALWIAALIALGCRREPQGFVPLEVGRRAVYDVEYVTGIGDVQRAQAILRIDGKKEIGGKEYFRVVTVITGIPGYPPETVYQRMAGDGLHEVRYAGDRPVEYLALPVPPEIGKTWAVDGGEIEMTCRVEAREPAILPEVTYEDAYRVSCSGTRSGVYFTNQTYMVAGLGPVKTVQEAGAVKMEMRLREVGRRRR
ncbi:MAG TPA: hypothetical protein VGG03_00420 [Thermoanaerobaculia bacterium]|jgi:hypothetical protein